MPHITTAKFDALRRAAYSGATVDMLLDWYQANGATSPALVDARREFLDAEGYTEASMGLAWKRFLRDRGFVDFNGGEATFWEDDMPMGASLTRYVGKVYGDSNAATGWGTHNKAFGDYLTAQPGWTETLDINRVAVPGYSLQIIEAQFFDGNTPFSEFDGNFVIIQGGINDCWPDFDNIFLAPTAAERLANMKASTTNMMNAALASGQLVILVSVTPFKGLIFWTAEKQSICDDYNAWAATTYPSNYFDAYSILEDPATPDTLLPAYQYPDSGSPDYIHINDAGYQACDAVMAARFDGVIRNT